MFIRVYYSICHLLSQYLGRSFRPLEYSEVLQVSQLYALEDEERCLFSLTIDDWLRMIRLIVSKPLCEHSQTSKELRNISSQFDFAKFICSHLANVKNSGARYVLFCDSEYPGLLRSIPNPPLALTVLGEPGVLNDCCISIVGSRRVTHRVADATKVLATELAARSVTIVSGGAFGCDIAAHIGALEVEGGRTIAIMAGGLSNLYPKGNGVVFRSILERGGAIVSEKHWEAKIYRSDFPIRNRIISGLSMVTVVMQADVKSGAMITAVNALDQGRDVAVFNHDSSQVGYEGSSKLRDEGAYTFSDPSAFVEMVSSR